MAEPLDVLSRFWADLVARPSGPFAFRFFVQPLIAAIFAVRDGIKDARTGRSPYFWAVLSQPRERHARLVEGIKATGKAVAIGLVIDTAYQLTVLGRFYPGEALAVALLLGFVPYLLIRGPSARVAKRRSLARRARR